MRTSSGISLIEILISTVFLMVLTVPIMNVFSQGVASTTMIRDDMLAADYATELLGIAETIPYEQLPTVESLEMPMIFAPGYSENTMPEGFRRYLTVKEFVCNNLNSARYKTIKVEIEWKSSGTARKIIVFSHIQAEI